MNSGYIFKSGSQVSFEIPWRGNLCFEMPWRFGYINPIFWSRKVICIALWWSNIPEVSTSLLSNSIWNRRKRHDKNFWSSCWVILDRARTMLGHLHDRAKILLLHASYTLAVIHGPLNIGLQPSLCKRFRAFLIQGKASNFPQLEQSIVPVYTCIASVGAITASTNHSDTKPKGQSGDYQSRDM